MKLFKSLLVAPAALGLLSPLAASASEANLNDIATYSDVDSIEFANSFGESEANEKQLIAGGEGLVSGSSHDGGFSETTTASFSADFYLGSVDAGTADTNYPVMATYGFQIDLNTSFTGEDSLDISLDAGNSVTGTGETSSVTEFDGNGTGDALNVDGVSYTFPLAGATVFVADNGDASALFTTACTYGGPTNTLDDCGNVNAAPSSGAVAFGSSYDFGNGFAAAVGYQSNSDEVNGLLTDESKDSLAFNASYTGSNYGASITYASLEDGAVSTSKEDNYTALNGYYTPDQENFPSISVGYEIGHDASVSKTLNEITSFFVGLQWDEVGPGSLGVAMGHSNTVEDAEEAYMYEAYYSYPINDGMTITPVIYTKENTTSGVDDTTGVLVKTSFSF